MDKETYKKKFTEEDAVGWLSIDNSLEKIYGKTEPKHYGPIEGLTRLLNNNVVAKKTSR